MTGNTSSGGASNFCSQCGERTISACPACDAYIRGDVEGNIVVGWSKPAAHCYNCGEAYPWSAAKLQAVAELADAITELTEFEREQLAELMPHIVQETPRTTVAGFKVATIWAKIQGPGKAAMKDLLMDIAVDAGKKALGFAG